MVYPTFFFAFVSDLFFWLFAMVPNKSSVRGPGIEPGSTAWKATMLTITPATLPMYQRCGNRVHGGRISERNEGANYAPLYTVANPRQINCSSSALGTFVQSKVFHLFYTVGEYGVSPGA